MPSGAKKRKAAKRKKENQSSNPSSPAHLHGNEDVKHQEDVESDVGENSSPKSHDHENTQMEGEEEEIGKLPNLPLAEGSKIENEDTQSEVGGFVVPDERDIKIEDELDKKNENIQCDEVSREYYNGGSSRNSSSSCSSDDENQSIENRKAESSIASFDSTEVGDSVSINLTGATCKSAIDEVDDSTVGDIPTNLSEKITLLNEQLEVDDHSPADISMAPYLVESPIKENGEKKFDSVEDKISVSMALVDAEIERVEEVLVQSGAKSATTSDPQECATQENGDKITSAYNAPQAIDDDEAEHMIDSQVTPQLAVAPQFPVQKTSWKSCCGLFEMFSKSGA